MFRAGEQAFGSFPPRLLDTVDGADLKLGEIIRL